MNSAYPPAVRPGRPVWVWILAGCGGAALLGVVAVVAFFVWAASGPESGVKLPNQMDAYAIKYLEEHRILEPGETVAAYYDETVRMSGEDASLVTDRRVISIKGHRPTAWPLSEVRDVRRSEGAVGGVAIELEREGGELMRLEFAPLNDGEVFLRVLEDRWRQARGSAPAGAP